MKKVFDQNVKNGLIKVGSDAWYEGLKAIQAIDDEIDQCTISIEQYNNAIIQLKWDKFDSLIDRLQAVDSEISNIRDHLAESDLVDDAGNWTNEGITSMALAVEQMESARYQVDQYSSAIKTLKKDYKDGKISESEYTDRLKELTETQWDSIDAYEQAKNDIVELNKTRVDAVKDGIQKEIDAYSDLIAKKKEALDKDKEQRDFNKTVQDQQSIIDKLRSQIVALESDPSLEARAKKQKLQQELYEAQMKMDDIMYDHSVDTQKDALDKELEDYQAIQDAKIQELEEYLEEESRVLDDSISLVLKKNEIVMNTLTEVSKEFGVTISDYIKKPWEDGGNAVADYGDKINTYTSEFVDGLSDIKTLLNDIEAQAKKTAEAAIDAIDKLAKETKTTSSTTNKSGSSTSSSGKSGGGSSGSSSSGGDGKLKSGEKVTFASGKYYFDSYGSGPSGSYHLGKKVKVSSVINSPKSGQNYPILI